MSASDIQRVFLQAVMSRQCMPERLAKQLCKNAIRAVKDLNKDLNIAFSNEWYEQFLVSVNGALEPFSLEFRRMKSEDTGEDVCAIINLKGDEVAQLATTFSATDIAYFKLIVEQIMLAPNESFCVSSMAALRETSNLPNKNLTKAQAEALLSSFVANGWLDLSKKGRYTLSTRSVMELQPYLKSTFEDEVLECTTCLEIVTKGISCHTPNCKCRLHNHCYRLQMNRRQKCPACGADWSGEPAPVKKVGEAAAGNDNTRSSKPSQRRSAARANPSSSQVDVESEDDDEVGARQQQADGGEEEEEEEEEDDDEPPPPPKGKGKGKETTPTNPRAGASSSKGKGKARQVQSDSDE